MRSAACGVQITPLPEVSAVDAHDPFALRIETWHALIHVLNNLNRSLGLGDAYPFVLPNAVLEKLRYVDQIVNQKQPADAQTLAAIPQQVRQSLWRSRGSDRLDHHGAHIQPDGGRR